jgi:hypothetical protein
MLWIKPPDRDVQIARNLWIRRLVSGTNPFPRNNVTVHEMEKMWGRTLDAPYFAIAESADREVSAFALAGLVWLITGQWKYYAGRARAFRKHASDTWPAPSEVGLSGNRLAHIRVGAKLALSNRRFRIALTRWCSSLDRTDSMDVVLDCCSCLEALFQTPSEHRLRTALAARHCVSAGKRHTFRITYELYGLRNQFVHGARIPDVADSMVAEFVGLVATLLREFIRQGRCPAPEDINAAIFEQLGGTVA